MFEALEDGDLGAMVLIDQKAAYDLMDHHILEAKMRGYNFSEETILWFRSYLQDRTSQVMVETKVSTPKDIGPYGAPQGSILGGILYLILCKECST